MSPRNQQHTSTAVTRTEDAASALANLPADVRADLLNAQKEMIGDGVRLPQVKIMPAGVGLYEFADTHETTREFVGVMLGAHPRNVLWEKPYGQGGTDDEPALPACVAHTAQHGTPREGYAHIMLGGRVATGDEQIPCRSCRFNAWGSRKLIPALIRPGEDVSKVKGKACTNQRAVYVLVENRQTPVELVLPPTSIPPFDEYVATLLNQSLPVQAVFTKFTQSIQNKGRMTWAVATFAAQDRIDAVLLNRVLAERNTWSNVINGTEAVALDSLDGPVAATGTLVNEREDGGETAEDDDNIPF